MNETAVALIELADRLEDENFVPKFSQDEIDQLLSAGLKIMGLCIEETADRDISERHGR